MSISWCHYICAFIVLSVCVWAGKTSESITQTWGYPLKYAGPVYDIEVKRPPLQDDKERNWLDVEYPETKLNQSNPSYTIVAMHAFDLLPVGLDQGKAWVLSGGVAYNYVKVRFVPCKGCGLYFRFTVYGLEL